MAIPFGAIFRTIGMGMRLGYLSIGVRLANVSTRPGQAVFWSGKGMLGKAAQFAADRGLKTLEMTSGGKWLTNATKNMSYDQSRIFWDRLSARFANQASGTVNILHGAEIRHESTWMTVERDILMSNPGITPTFKF